MNCDKCGEELGILKVDKVNGEAWCLKCAKSEISFPVEETSLDDPFITLCRKVRSMRNTNSEAFDVVILGERGERTYTNAQVLISESKTFEKRGALDLTTLESKSVEAYPDINRVLELGWSDVVIDISDSFIDCLKAFDRGSMEITSEGIRIEELEEGIKLYYGESDTSKMSFDVKFDIEWFRLFEPRSVVIGNHNYAPCLFKECRVPGLEKAEHVVVMPLMGE